MIGALVVIWDFQYRDGVGTRVSCSLRFISAKQPMTQLQGIPGRYACRNPVGVYSEDKRDPSQGTCFVVSQEYSIPGEEI